jgi:lactate dehydrogenase-like 2-hydroxyacid dehydrogenase
MTKPGLLQIGPMIASCADALDEAFAVRRYWEAADKAAFLAAEGAQIRAVATDGHSGCSAEIMAQLPNLEVIGCYCVGYDAIDMAAAEAKDVRVTNTPDVLNDAVAELTLGLMLALNRRIADADRFVRAGSWEGAKGLEAGAYPLTSNLAGATAGILGLGRIGKEIALRLRACKVDVAYHGRTEQPDQPYRFFPSLIEMAREVDWLVVIAPGSAATKGIVSREVMAALGPKGALVNVARGSLVDEPALIELLQSGALGGAALDVFADEPRVPDALKTMTNVVLSPHAGSATTQTRWAMGDLVVRNLKAHFAGEPLITPVR